MKMYYDPEYDRTVDETVVRKQYEWFEQHGINKTFEQFAEDNFTELKTTVKQYELPVPEGADDDGIHGIILNWLEKNRIRREKADEEYRGTLEEDWFRHGKYRYRVTIDSVDREAGTAKVSLIAV